MSNPDINLPIYQTLFCKDEVHCKTCRSDPRWRDSIAALHGENRNFACPHGKPIVDNAPDATPISDERERRTAARESAIKRIGKGLLSIVKTTIGIDRADETIVAERKKICAKCEYYTPCLFKTRHCCGVLLIGDKDPDNPACGCILENKWKDVTHVCPKDKW